MVRGANTTLDGNDSSFNLQFDPYTESMNLLGAMPKRFTARLGIRVSLAKQQQRALGRAFWEKEKGSLTLARDPFLTSSRRFLSRC